MVVVLVCSLLLTLTAGAAAAQSWTTAPEFAIGGPPESDSSLWFVGDVDVGPEGRVYVVELTRARRVTVWELPGALTLELGPSSQAGPFGSPIRVQPDSAGFRVTYRGTVIRYDKSGNVLATVQRPPEEDRGFDAVAMVDDGLFLAIGKRPTNVGRTAEEAVWDWPLFSVRRGQDGWTTDTIAVLDGDRSVLVVSRDARTAAIPNSLYTSQPFSDSDFPYLAGRDRLGVVVRSGAPGEVRLSEISVSGDTVWSRVVSVPPQRLTAEALQSAYDRVTASVLRSHDPSRHASEETLRQRVVEAVYTPDYLPAITTMAATGSGEMWLRSSETADTLVAWYSLKRDDPSASLRRVLLPTWLRVHDATSTHVWGTRMDSRGAAQVLGRRLIAPGNPR